MYAQVAMRRAGGGRSVAFDDVERAFGEGRRVEHAYAHHYGYDEEIDDYGDEDPEPPSPSWIVPLEIGFVAACICGCLTEFALLTGVPSLLTCHLDCDTSSLASCRIYNTIINGSLRLLQGSNAPWRWVARASAEGRASAPRDVVGCSRKVSA